MKYAIRIVSSTTGDQKLFAVCEERNGEVYRHYQLAKRTIPYGSSDWVVMGKWTNPDDWDVTYQL